VEFYSEQWEKTKWEDGGEWKWYENDDDNRYGRYKGEIKNGLPNGQGTVKTTLGEKYGGEWKDGNFDGQGTMFFPNGHKYVGEFRDGYRNGQGTFTYPDGGKYVGEFKDNKPWNGTEYDKDGNITKKYVNGEMILQ